MRTGMNGSGSLLPGAGFSNRLPGRTKRQYPKWLRIVTVLRRNGDKSALEHGNGEHGALAVVAAERKRWYSGLTLAYFTVINV